MINKSCICSFIFPLICFSQTLTGKVTDKITQEPIITAAVYFDNTTIGTTTDDNGLFSIDYTEAIRSNLVISYLGYEMVIVSDYRQQSNLNIELIPAINTLEEVYLDYDDGLTRKQKLKLFRKEFLGSSRFGKSSKILNEDDLVLRYNKRDLILYASAPVPLKVKNKALNYEVDFDIIDFEVRFKFADLETLDFALHSVTYLGTSFYKDLNEITSKRIVKNRALAYKGSVQHFMRALYTKNLRGEGFWIFFDKFRVDEWSYFTVADIDNSIFKKVTLSSKISILFNKDLQSELQLDVPEFYIDAYGNYTPIIGVYFSGYMGNQRIGDSLPLDYSLGD